MADGGTSRTRNNKEPLATRLRPADYSYVIIEPSGHHAKLAKCPIRSRSIVAARLETVVNLPHPDPHPPHIEHLTLPQVPSSSLLMLSFRLDVAAASGPHHSSRLTSGQQHRDKVTLSCILSSYQAINLSSFQASLQSAFRKLTSGAVARGSERLFEPHCAFPGRCTGLQSGLRTEALRSHPRAAALVDKITLRASVPSRSEI